MECPPTLFIETLGTQRCVSRADRHSANVNVMEEKDTPSAGLSGQEIRLSDADREAVITQLREATDEGRISLLEFEERSGLAYRAQFASDLAPLTADLPQPGSDLPNPVQPAAVETQASKPRWSVQIMGGTERRGDWYGGGEAKSLSIMGGQTLDLTQVTVNTVNLTCYHLMGGTTIIVPDGARVEFVGFILFGGNSDETVAVGPSEMVVRVRSRGAMGGCTFRNLKRKERRKRGLPPR